MSGQQGGTGQTGQQQGGTGPDTGTGGQQQQGQGQPAGQPQDQTQQQGLGLLDEAAGQQQDGTDGQQSSQTGNQQGAGGGGGVSDERLAQMIADAVQRTVDQRINDRLANRLTGGQQPQQQQPGNGGGQQERRDQPGQQTPTGPDPADFREARQSYREYVGDQITFFPFEREYANGLAGNMLRDRVARGEDPDSAGREVAREVATSLKALRAQYESSTVAALRRKGLLRETADGHQPPPGGSAPGDASTYQKGQAAAQRLLPDRFPRQQ